MGRGDVDLCANNVEKILAEMGFREYDPLLLATELVLSPRDQLVTPLGDIRHDWWVASRLSATRWKISQSEMAPGKEGKQLGSRYWFNVSYPWHAENGFTRKVVKGEGEGLGSWLWATLSIPSVSLDDVP
jgi:hypothetical protein